MLTGMLRHGARGLDVRHRRELACACAAIILEREADADWVRRRCRELNCRNELGQRTASSSPWAATRSYVWGSYGVTACCDRCRAVVPGAAAANSAARSGS